jgi:O-antigen/teichoic acid export membrane protein
MRSITAPASVRQSFIIYTVAFAVAGATPFLLLPFLTRLLSPAEFGVVTSFIMLTSLVANVAGVTAHGFVSVRFFKVPSSSFGSITFTSLTAVVGAHCIAILLLMAFSSTLSANFNLSPEYVVLTALGSLLLNVNIIFLAIFQSSRQPLMYLGARIIQSVCELGVCAALMMWVAADERARIGSYLAALFFSALFGVGVAMRNRHVVASFDRAILPDLFRFGVPLLPHVIAGTALVQIDRIVVSSKLGADGLGVYMVAMQIGLAMMVFIEPLSKSLAPWLFGELARNDFDSRHTIVKWTYFLFIGLVVVGAVVAVAAHLLFDQIIGHEFHDARTLIPWVVAAFVLQGMYYCVVNYLFYAEKTGRLSIVSGATACLGLLCSVVLTTRFGLRGACASFLLTNAVLFLAVWAVAARTVHMPWLLRRQA